MYICSQCWKCKIRNIKNQSQCWKCKIKNTKYTSKCWKCKLNKIEKYIKCWKCKLNKIEKYIKCRKCKLNKIEKYTKCFKCTIKWNGWQQTCSGGCNWFLTDWITNFIVMEYDFIPYHLEWFDAENSSKLQNNSISASGTQYLVVFSLSIVKYCCKSGALSFGANITGTHCIWWGDLMSKSWMQHNSMFVGNGQSSMFHKHNEYVGPKPSVHPSFCVMNRYVLCLCLIH